MLTNVGIRSLAVGFPGTLRTPEYWKRNHPSAVAEAESRSLGRLFAGEVAPTTDPFQIEMQPYLADPFRGTVECRVLGPGESALSIELMAARDALSAARMTPRDVSAIMTSSFIPDHIHPGNAAFLARELGVDAPAWNIESACTSTVVGLQSATALVRAGEFRNILLVTSCTYSRMLDEADSLSWFMADGAGAVVVGEVAQPYGVLGTKLISTKETCGAFLIEPLIDRSGTATLRMRSGDEEAARLMRDNARQQLEACAAGALAAAGVALSDINFFIFNTPTAWFARFCARVLGIDVDKTVSIYDRYGNIGSALTTANLYHAALEGKIVPGDLVLVYAVGSVSTAGATVLRWGDVALGPPPPPSSALRAA